MSAAATEKATPARAPKAKAFKTYTAKTGEIQQKWFIVDIAGQSLGRISTVIARRLMGKDKAVYTSHIDTGDFVIVVNSEKVSVHQNKMDTKTYRKWSGFPGGLRVRTLAQEQAKNPNTIITESIRRMLPKTMLGKVMLSKLKVYVGTDHPHSAQQPEAWVPLPTK
ncbi:MAG: 50S ribosomal protein L13 [Planctomycetota bacterium]